MADSKATRDAKEELRRARAKLHEDVADLSHHLHVDIPARVKAKAPAIAAGAAAVTAAAVGIVAAKRRRKSASRPSQGRPGGRGKSRKR